MEKNSSSERQAALAACAVLLLILVGILMEQRRWSPALALAQPEMPAAGRSDLPVPEGLEALGEGEIFDAETLSDKINGRAELYLAAGFKRLTTRRMGVPGAPARWLELYVYTMASSDAAYAVFSGQRRPGAPALPVGDEGYLAGNAGFAYAGATYAEALAAEPGMEESVHAVLREVLGEAVAKPARSGSPADLLPVEGRVPGSEALLSEDAFGCQGFDRVLMAAYSNAVGSGTLFLSRRATPEEAQALADRYSAFVLENGGAAADAGALELFGRFEAVAAAGSDLFGVHGATSAEWARAQLADLRARVEGGPDASP